MFDSQLSNVPFVVLVVFMPHLYGGLWQDLTHVILRITFVMWTSSFVFVFVFDFCQRQEEGVATRVKAKRERSDIGRRPGLRETQWSVDLSYTQLIVLVDTQDRVPALPPIDFCNQANLEVQSVDKGVGRLKLVLVRVTIPRSCHERLVKFFTDVALSIDRALVYATHRGDL